MYLYNEHIVIGIPWSEVEFKIELVSYFKMCGKKLNSIYILMNLNLYVKHSLILYYKILEIGKNCF